MKNETVISVVVAVVLVITSLFDFRIAALFATIYLIAFTIHRIIFRTRRRR